MGQDEGQFLPGREELLCNSAVRDGREKLHRSQARGNANVPHVGAGEMVATNPIHQLNAILYILFFSFFAAHQKLQDRVRESRWYKDDFASDFYTIEAYSIKAEKKESIVKVRL